MTAPTRETVFLVHGRNADVRDQMVLFLQSLGFSVLNWSQCREGVDANNPSTLEIVDHGIRSSTATVVLVTPDDVAQLHPSLGTEKRRHQPRPNVIFELGIALALRPEATAIIRVGSADLHSDIDCINVCALGDGPEARRDAVRVLRKAGLTPDESGDSYLLPNLSGTFEFEIAPPSEPLLPPLDDDGFDPTVMSETSEPLSPDSTLATLEAAEQDLRGLYTEYVVDSALSTRLSSAKLFQDLRKNLRAGQPVELKYHYVGNRLAEYWTAVVDDPSYGHDLLSYTTSIATREILEAAQFGACIDFISLGPGDGRFDHVLLNNILATGQDVAFYYPVDISQELLQLTVMNIQTKVTKEDLRIKAFVADFEDSLVELDFLMRADDRPALYALTGFTLGNSREDRLLDSVRTAMRPGDRLLVDCRLHKVGKTANHMNMTSDDVDDLMRPYMSHAVEQFAFGPVEVATDFTLTLDDVDIVRRVEKGKSVSAVPNSINAFLMAHQLFKRKHERFLAKLGLDVTKQADQMRVVNMGKKRYVELAMVTFYDYMSLGQWFSQRGFRVVWSAENEEALGIFLLAPDIEEEE